MNEHEECGDRWHVEINWIFYRHIMIVVNPFCKLYTLYISYNPYSGLCSHHKHLNEYYYYYVTGWKETVHSTNRERIKIKKIKNHKICSIVHGGFHCLMTTVIMFGDRKKKRINKIHIMCTPYFVHSALLAIAQRNFAQIVKRSQKPVEDIAKLRL